MAIDRLGRVPTIVLALAGPAGGVGHGAGDPQRDRRLEQLGIEQHRRGEGRFGHRDLDQELPVLAGPFTVKAGATVTVTNDDGTRAHAHRRQGRVRHR